LLNGNKKTQTAKISGVGADSPGVLAAQSEKLEGPAMEVMVQPTKLTYKPE
jgi:hypothetical protein